MFYLFMFLISPVENGLKTNLFSELRMRLIVWFRISRHSDFKMLRDNMRVMTLFSLMTKSMLTAKYKPLLL